MRSTFVCAALAAAAATTAFGEDFPLTFKTIPASNVMAFPGGYGTYGQLKLAKPARIKKEPPAVSRKPLYGECRETPGGGAFLFRLDESEGDGKGYDRLIVDLNGNADLTDDAVAQRVILPADRKPTTARAPQRLLFGPLTAPAANLIAGERPVYYAQVYVSPLPTLRPGLSTQNIYAGQLRLKAGWYLETTVQADGRKQKVGVFDSDSNLRLGDLPRPATSESDGRSTWYFQPGDALLVDSDNSNTFDSDAFDREECPFGSLLYFGATPYKVALARDNKSLSLTRWSEALAEVTVQPRGKQVRTVTLAWEQPKGKWQLVRAGVADAKVRVPPGDYRLYRCTLLGEGGAGGPVMTSATQSTVKKPVSFAAGKPNTLACGAPLNIKVTAEKRKPESWELSGRSPKDPQTDSDYVLTINAEVVGAGGEVYSGFAKGAKLRDEPSKPAFTVTDTGGRKVANGNLEFG